MDTDSLTRLCDRQSDRELSGCSGDERLQLESADNWLRHDDDDDDDCICLAGGADTETADWRLSHDDDDKDDADKGIVDE